jgi:hypothetical protein
MGVAYLSTPAYASAKNLARCCTWVEMEDYVANYPKAVKERALSVHLGHISFFLAALFPQIPFSRTESENNFVFSQFQPEWYKGAILQKYFTDPDPTQWFLAIHQFQQLSLDAQLALGPYLRERIDFMAKRDELPNGLPSDVRFILLNERLKSMLGYPDTESRQWQTLAAEFEKLSREQQSILGQALIHLVKCDTDLSRTSIVRRAPVLPETMRLAALKGSIHNIDDLGPLVNAVFKQLSPAFQDEFIAFLKEEVNNRPLDIARLSYVIKCRVSGQERDGSTS